MTIPPLLFALLMWFIGTAAIVWLDSRPARTFRISLALGGMIALAALVAVRWRTDDGSVAGAYVGFAAAIVVWAWHEMSFLMGLVSGPNRAPAAPGLAGWARFRAASATVIHHEIAIATTLLLLVALTWGAVNQAAPLTFALLFALRLSAKLNIFLGVPNLSDEVFPAHLAYLKSHFRTAPGNALLPVSLLGAGAVALWAWQAAEAAPADSGRAATGSLLAMLAVLGLVEHLFLVLPLKDGAMWRWARGRDDINENDAGEARHGL